MAVNYLGAIAVARAALPALRQSGGRIVATSSLAAFIPIPFQAGYSASKAALEVTLHALALEARPFGVRCTCVQLGDTQTGFTQHRRRVRAAQTDTLYAARFEKSVGKMEADEQNGCPAEKAAAFLVRQLERKNPPPTAACGLQRQGHRAAQEALAPAAGLEDRGENCTARPQGLSRKRRLPISRVFVQRKPRQLAGAKVSI